MLHSGRVYLGTEPMTELDSTVSIPPPDLPTTLPDDVGVGPITETGEAPKTKALSHRGNDAAAHKGAMPADAKGLTLSGVMADADLRANTSVTEEATSGNEVTRYMQKLAVAIGEDGTLHPISRRVMQHPRIPVFHMSGPKYFLEEAYAESESGNSSESRREKALCCIALTWSCRVRITPTYWPSERPLVSYNPANTRL